MRTSIAMLNHQHPILMRLLATAAFVACAAMVAGFGTYGMFTGTTNASHTVSTGGVLLEIGQAGTTGNRFDVDSGNLLPGETSFRSFDIANSSDVSLSSIELISEASQSSLLDTDEVNGLQMKFDVCSIAWLESGSAPDFGYDCNGTETEVAGWGPIIRNNLTFNFASGFEPGDELHFKVSIMLPEEADNRFQGLTSEISYQFAGVPSVDF